MSKKKSEPMVQKAGQAEPAQAEAGATAETAATTPTDARKGRPAAKRPPPGAKPAKAGAAPARGAVRSPKAKRPPKRARMSGLDAAAKVLAEAGKPMRCQDVVERALAKGLWKTKGRTPAATIHSAVIREIKLKGKESRFKKAGRGLFIAR